MNQHPYGPQWVPVTTTGSDYTLSNINWASTNTGSALLNPYSTYTLPVQIVGSGGSTLPFDYGEPAKSVYSKESPLDWLDRRVSEITDLIAA